MMLCSRRWWKERRSAKRIRSLILLRLRGDGRHQSWINGRLRLRGCRSQIFGLLSCGSVRQARINLHALDNMVASGRKIGGRLKAANRYHAISLEAHGSRRCYLINLSDASLQLDTFFCLYLHSGRKRTKVLNMYLDACQFVFKTEKVGQSS